MIKSLLGKGNRTVLVDISDSHSGHKLGLINPETPKRDGFVPANHMNENHEHLAKLHERAFKEVVEFAGKDELVVFHLGELCQGEGKHEQLISTRMSDQIWLAKYVMIPWLDLPNVNVGRLVIGSNFHEFGEGSATLLVADPLEERYGGKKDIRFIFQGLRNINGIYVDYSHHGPPPGSREWLKGNMARYYLRDRMWMELLHGKLPPKLYLRAHYHEPISEVVNILYKDSFYESRIVINPSMCMLGDFARKSTKSIPYITNGITYYEFIDGVLGEPHFVMETVDVRTYE